MAVKFLMARKFDVDRAIKLYEDHEVNIYIILLKYNTVFYLNEKLKILFYSFQNLRKKEGLFTINLSDEAFIKDLESGKFTILV